MAHFQLFRQFPCPPHRRRHIPKLNHSHLDVLDAHSEPPVDDVRRDILLQLLPGKRFSLPLGKLCRRPQSAAHPSGAVCRLRRDTKQHEERHNGEASALPRLQLDVVEPGCLSGPASIPNSPAVLMGSCWSAGRKTTVPLRPEFPDQDS